MTYENSMKLYCCLKDLQRTADFKDYVNLSVPTLIIIVFGTRLATNFGNLIFYFIKMQNPTEKGKKCSLVFTQPS